MNNLGYLRPDYWMLRHKIVQVSKRKIDISSFVIGTSTIADIFFFIRNPEVNDASQRFIV